MMRVLFLVPVLLGGAATLGIDQAAAVAIRCEGTLRTNDENKILDGQRSTSAHDTFILVADEKSKTIKSYDPKEQRLYDVCGGPACSIRITDQQISWSEEGQEPRWYHFYAGSVDRVAGTASRSILDKILSADGETQHITDMEGIYPTCDKYDGPLAEKKPRF